MEITIFSKKRQSRDGRTFYNFISTLTDRNGNEKTMQVKFREEGGTPKPEKCPMNILISKTDCNISKRRYKDKDGLECEALTLWISRWEPGTVYIDHSTDDYDF